MKHKIRYFQTEDARRRSAAFYQALRQAALDHSPSAAHSVTQQAMQEAFL